MNEQDEVLTVEEVANLLKQKPGFVKDHACGRRRPIIPSFKHGRNRRFLKSEVLKYLADVIARDRGTA